MKILLQESLYTVLPFNPTNYLGCSWINKCDQILPVCVNYSPTLYFYVILDTKLLEKKILNSVLFSLSFRTHGSLTCLVSLETQCFSSKFQMKIKLALSQLIVKELLVTVDC